MAEKAPKITKIEPAIASLPIRKRVAAYARVSMVTDRLMCSCKSFILRVMCRTRNAGTTVNCPCF